MSGHSTRIFAAILVFSIAVAKSASQTANTNETQNNVVLSKLFRPVYPPLALLTRLTGDVELALEVRMDGSLESVNAISGHPILQDAALDSARRSLFECRDCRGGSQSLHLIYSFQLGLPPKCSSETSKASNADEKQEDQPRVIHSQNRITVIDQGTGTCGDMTFAPHKKKARKLKCLYLWRCGSVYVTPEW